MSTTWSDMLEGGEEATTPMLIVSLTLANGECALGDAVAGGRIDDTVPLRSGWMRKIICAPCGGGARYNQQPTVEQLTPLGEAKYSLT